MQRAALRRSVKRRHYYFSSCAKSKECEIAPSCRRQLSQLKPVNPHFWSDHQAAMQTALLQATSSLPKTAPHVGSTGALQRYCCHSLPAKSAFLIGARHLRNGRATKGQHCAADPATSLSVAALQRTQEMPLPMARCTAFSGTHWPPGRHKLHARSAAKRTQGDPGSRLSVHASLVPRFGRVVKSYTLFYGDAAGQPSDACVVCSRFLAAAIFVTSSATCCTCMCCLALAGAAML